MTIKKIKEKLDCECGRPIKVKSVSLCWACYQRAWKNNSLKRTRVRHSISLNQRMSERYSPEPNSGCWLWTGTISVSGGYGIISYKGKVFRAHVVSYEACNGPVPQGLCVCHKCDVPSCINPSHLFLGTHKDNMDDRDRKGRTPRGEKSATSKLTEKQVLLIKKSNDRRLDLAAKFNVTPSNIGAIRRGKSWAWLNET